MSSHALRLTVQSVIAIGVLCAIFLSSALAAVPDKIKQRFALLENYGKKLYRA